MNLRHPSLPTLVLLACSAPAFGQLRCDCTSVVDSCAADVAIRGTLIEITSDHLQCSRVDYFIDGQPFVSLVVDGEARESWPVPTDRPRVLVQSCQVCLDNGSGLTSSIPAAPPERAEPEPAFAPRGSLEPLIQVAPEYPAAAAAMRVEGRVDLEVVVDARGIVEDASVLAAEPPGAFDEAALAAVRRWRYPASPGRALQALIATIEFRLADARTEPAPQPAARASAARRGPRNECVREGMAFNYGDRVEVSLMNACDTPIMVFGCAQGSGRYQGRWVCESSEQRDSVLVRPGDDRVGGSLEIEERGSPVSLLYEDQFLVERAPNSEYWWLACTVEDETCRSDARQWNRSLDGQLASADPQGRSSAPLARSY